MKKKRKSFNKLKKNFPSKEEVFQKKENKNKSEIIIEFDEEEKVFNIF